MVLIAIEKLSFHSSLETWGSCMVRVLGICICISKTCSFVPYTCLFPHPRALPWNQNRREGAGLRLRGYASMSPPILYNNQDTQFLEHSLPSDETIAIRTVRWYWHHHGPSFVLMSTPCVLVEDFSCGVHPGKTFLHLQTLVSGHFNALRVFSQNLGSQWEKC